MDNEEKIDLINAENAIISTLVWNYGLFPSINEILQEEHFDNLTNRKIFKVFGELYSKNETWDIVKIAMYNKEFTQYVANISILDQLRMIDDNALNVAYSIKNNKLINHTKQRLHTISKEITKDNYDEALQSVIDLKGRYNNDLPEQIRYHIPKFREHILQDKTTARLSTPFTELNRVLGGGYKKGKLHVIASRPSQGKTSMAVTLMNHALREGRKVGFISLEMTSEEIFISMIANGTGLNNQDVESYYFTKKEQTDKFQEYINYLVEKDFYLCDKSSMTGLEVHNKIKIWFAKYGIDEVYIDYLGLVQQDDSAFNEVRAIEKNVQYINQALKDTGVTGFLLCQLNREIEKRSSCYKFQPSDIRGSGAIEQEAYTIFFIARPEYYGLKVLEEYDRMPTQGLAMFVGKKHRMGKIGTVLLDFVGENNLFRNRTFVEEEPKQLGAF